MARGLNIFALMVMLVAALLQSSAAQTTHVVGDSLSWAVQTDGAAAYSTWASAQNFSVGDVLVFNFATGGHTVAEVRSAAFDACTIANPISISSTGPTSITLNSAGEHYFICTVGQHCSAGGQKLAINVTGTPTTSPPPSTTAPPPSTTTTPPSTTAPPPPNGVAPSLAVAGVPLALLSIAMALLY